MTTYTAEEIASAAQREREEGTFTFSDLSRRCSRCRVTVDLMVSELDPATGRAPKGEYLCADCDAGIYPDPRER